jgi:hypothetical protein
LRQARARLIHQDAPHETRRNGKEVRTVLPARRALIDQAQERFVHQPGGL